MKKIIIVQGVVIVTLLVFSFIQKAQADKAKDEALMAQQKAMAAQMEAEQQKQIAIKNQEEAMRFKMQYHSILTG